MKSIEAVFAERTCYKFLPNKKVEDKLLHEIYDTVKLGPTSANSCPMRIMFVQTKEGKEKLFKCLMPGNVEKTRSAPVTAIFAFDTKFYDLLPKLLPHDPSFQKYFSSSKDLALDTATRNSTLQSAYFMIVARSKGLDCGPMSGFDRAAIDNSFFKDSSWKANFLCNLGYADGPSPYPKLPRLNFDECCKIV